MKHGLWLNGRSFKTGLHQRHRLELDSIEWRRREGGFVGGLNSSAHFATIWWTVWPERGREWGCRRYWASQHLIHSVNSTGSVNYIWAAAKQWVFFAGTSTEYLGRKILLISKTGITNISGYPHADVTWEYALIYCDHNASMCSCLFSIHAYRTHVFLNFLKVVFVILSMCMSMHILVYVHKVCSSWHFPNSVAISQHHITLHCRCLQWTL